MRFLFAAPALCLATGACVAILISETGLYSRLNCYAGATAIIILLRYFFNISLLCTLQLFLLGILSGWVSADLHFKLPGNLSLASNLGSTSSWAEIRGIVYPSGNEEVLLVELKSWRRLAEANWHPVNARIRISGPFDRVWNSRQFFSHEIHATGLIRPVLKEVSLQQDLQKAQELRRDGVIYDLALADWQDLTVTETRPLPYWNRIKIQTSQWLTFRRLWASEALGYGIEKSNEGYITSSPWIDMIRAMALGERERLDFESRDLFQRTGTYHAFAISGLHVSIITGLGALIFRTLRIPNLGWYQGMMLFTWAYVALTGWQPSAIRAAIFWGVSIAALAMQRPYRGMNTLGLAAWIMLMSAPSDLFKPGFHLSFLVTAALLIWLPRWKISNSDQQYILIHEKTKAAAIGRCLKNLGAWCLIYLSFQIAAGVGSTPLVMEFFHRISPASLLSNLIIFPCLCILMASIVSSLALAALSLPGVVWMNHTAWLTMKLLYKWCVWIDSFEWSDFEILAPGVGFLLVWYFWMFFGWIDAGWYWIRQHRWIHLCVCCSLLMASYQPAGRLAAGEFRLIVFNCNAGDGIWMDFPGSQNDLMLDGCRSNSWNREVLPILRKEGIRSIQSWAFSHGDIAHFEVGASEWDRWNTQQFIFPNAKHLSGAFNKFRRTLEQLKETSRPELQILALDESDWMTPGVEVLAPLALDAGEYKSTSADFSPMALYFHPESNTAHAGILILSDMDGLAQSHFLKRYSELKVDGIIASSNTDMSQLKTNLIRAYEPEWVIINSGLYPAYQKTPEIEKLRILKECGIQKVWDTQETGSLEIRIRNGRLQILPI